MAADLSIEILPPEAWTAAVHALHTSSAPQPPDVSVGAFAGAALVGVVKCSPSGSCHVCGHGGMGERPAGAVEPSLHGQGIGRRVMAAALAVLDDAGAPAVLLECQDHRVAFYEACGFTSVGTFPDPAGPHAHLMRSDR